MTPELYWALKLALWPVLGPKIALGLAMGPKIALCRLLACLSACHPACLCLCLCLCLCICLGLGPSKASADQFNLRVTSVLRCKSES